MRPALCGQKTLLDYKAGQDSLLYSSKGMNLHFKTIYSIL